MTWEVGGLLWIKCFSWCFNALSSLCSVHKDHNAGQSSNRMIHPRSYCRRGSSEAILWTLLAHPAIFPYLLKFEAIVTNLILMAALNCLVKQRLALQKH